MARGLVVTFFPSIIRPMYARFPDIVLANFRTHVERVLIDHTEKMEQVSGIDLLGGPVLAFEFTQELGEDLDEALATLARRLFVQFSMRKERYFFIESVGARHIFLGPNEILEINAIVRASSRLAEPSN